MKVGALNLFGPTPKVVAQALHHPPTKEICELVLEDLAKDGRFNEVQEVAATFMRGQRFRVCTLLNVDPQNRDGRLTTNRAINDGFVQR